jgi:hypothetical protein
MTSIIYNKIHAVPIEGNADRTNSVKPLFINKIHKEVQSTEKLANSLSPQYSAVRCFAILGQIS